MRIIAAATFFAFLALNTAFGQTRTARIEVDAPPFQGIQDDAKLIAAPAAPDSERDQFQQAIKDVHFDFDRADLREQDRQVLASDAEWLKAHSDVVITLEGDADDRGDILYNLVLSGERAETTRQALLQLGIGNNRIAFSTGWGKLYPVCAQTDENCWSQNRRTHIGLWPPAQQTATSNIALAEK